MKKSNPFAAFFKSTFQIALFALLFAVTSCDYDEVSGPQPDPDPPEEPPADTADTVSPDGILETVTWNIEWYGSFGNGPDDEDLQANNVIKVVDSLNADLYAFQEITDQTALDKITSRMKGYRGFVAEYIDYNQKMAFVFNTQAIDSVSSGPITEFQEEFNWAGRFPFYFSFNYTFEGTTIPVYAVVIHAKCCADQESYERREEAAESLHTFLTRRKPSAHIVFLGDYNDDVDVSIYKQEETPYQPFVSDNDDFLVVTQPLSQEGVSSTVGYEDIVDHITVSNEMEPLYVMDSVRRFLPTNDFIENYAATTSDHYPIIAEFDIRP